VLAVVVVIKETRQAKEDEIRSQCVTIASSWTLVIGTLPSMSRAADNSLFGMMYSE
jgi:hypothetical protein